VETRSFSGRRTNAAVGALTPYSSSSSAQLKHIHGGTHAHTQHYPEELSYRPGTHHGPDETTSLVPPYTRLYVETTQETLSSASSLLHTQGSLFK
jgi:hypothetical protein